MENTTPTPPIPVTPPSVLPSQPTNNRNQSQNPFGIGRMDASSLGNMSQMMQDNPDFLTNMMNNPMMQSIFDNPDIMRSMIENNPQMQELLDRNPQMRQALNNPEILRRQMEMMRNPQALQEMMRQQDLQMSHLENMPGGYNALRQHFEQVQEPMMDALDGRRQSGENNGNDDEEEAEEENNPWGPAQPQNSTQPTNTTNNTAPNGNPLSSLLGGLNLSQPNTNNNPPAPMDPATLGQMMTNMGAMLQSMGNNPNQTSQGQGMPNMAEMLRAMGNQNGSGNAQGQQPPQNMDVNAMLQGLRAVNQFVPMAGAGGTSTVDSSLPPEERFATQLEQLEQMGFPNKQNNLAALSATNGNVDMAIDRLLGTGL